MSTPVKPNDDIVSTINRLASSIEMCLPKRFLFRLERMRRAIFDETLFRGSISNVNFQFTPSFHSRPCQENTTPRDKSRLLAILKRQDFPEVIGSAILAGPMGCRR